MDQAAIEDCTQKAEWRTRVLMAVVNRTFDDETLLDMLNAGWEQAHSEGLRDAAAICDSVAVGVADPTKQHTAQALAKACRELDALNKSTRAAGQGALK